MAVGPGAARRSLAHLRARASRHPRRPTPNAFPASSARSAQDGPLGYSTDVRITETNDEKGQPRTIDVRARSTSLTLDLRFDVASIGDDAKTQGPLGNGVDFLQMRGQYTASGQAGARDIAFTAPGSAETFRGN